MDQAVWFTPDGPGIEVPVDWLGVEGFQLTLTQGGSTSMVLQRTGPSPVCGRGDAEQRLLAHGVPLADDYHELQVVDRATGRPVPAVRLIVGGREGWTDNGGRVAFFDLDLTSTLARVEVWAHGYAPTELQVQIDPGGSTGIEIDRAQIAERLVRLTGGGTWRDTALLGHPVPIAEPFLDSQVLGQDTVHVVPWRGGLFWLWGDTNRPSYLLGNFHTTGATTALAPDLQDGVDYDYFEAVDGFVAPIAPSFAEGPVWLGGLVALSDDELWASYVNVGSNFEVFHEGVRAVERREPDLRRGRAVRPRSAGEAERPGGVGLGGPRGTSWCTAAATACPPIRRPCPMPPPTPPTPRCGPTARSSATRTGCRCGAGAAMRRLHSTTGSFEGLAPAEASLWHHALDPATGATPVLHQGSLMFSPARGPLAARLHREHRRKLVDRRNLVCRGGHAGGPLDLDPPGDHPRRLLVLQSHVAPPGPRPRGGIGCCSRGPTPTGSAPSPPRRATTTTSSCTPSTSRIPP